jgi:hypothetical protein
MCNDCDDDIQVSTRVTNLLYLIDELGLNQLEMSDLSAGIHNRMDWVREDAVEVCDETKLYQIY